MKRYGTARIINLDAPCKAANLERTASDEPLESRKNPAFDTPVRIRIHSYRNRLADCDGISGKAAIDGLVLCGIIKDDSTKEVAEVSYHQTKVKSKSEEKTVITIERV